MEREGCEEKNSIYGMELIQHSLDQWFSTRTSFTSWGHLANMWKHFCLSQLCARVEAMDIRMNVQDRLLTQRIICPKCQQHGG
jgi:hypothetical protein